MRLLAAVGGDADVRVALTRLVSSAGFDVETFASGLRFLETREPDCFVLDLHMPELDGFDVQGALARGHATSAAYSAGVATGAAMAGPPAVTRRMTLPKSSTAGRHMTCTGL